MAARGSGTAGRAADGCRDGPGLCSTSSVGPLLDQVAGVHDQDPVGRRSGRWRCRG